MKTLQEWKKKSLHANICRLVLSSTIYNIWRNRNEIKHGSHTKTEEQILQRIFWEVRSKVLGKGRLKKTLENMAICWNWSIKVKPLV